MEMCAVHEPGAWQARQEARELRARSGGQGRSTTVTGPTAVKGGQPQPGDRTLKAMGLRSFVKEALRVTAGILPEASLGNRLLHDLQVGRIRGIRPGRVSPPLKVPEYIRKPAYVDGKGRPEQPLESQVHDLKGVQAMRESCRLAAQACQFAGTFVEPGTTTDDIDKATHEFIVKMGAYPSPLGYARFPKSICTSVNEVVCHGIPDSRPLQDGDIINIDVTVYKRRYHGDTSRTFLCGNVSEQHKELVEATREALALACSICGPGVEYKCIGQIIHDYADKHKYGVIRDFLGHGIGEFFHSGPPIIPYRNKIPGRMQVGETFTIEPIFTTGGTRFTLWDDGWTAVSTDGSYSAQFEHTVLITDTGAEILTQ